MSRGEAAAEGRGQRAGLRSGRPGGRRGEALRRWHRAPAAWLPAEVTASLPLALSVASWLTGHCFCQLPGSRTEGEGPLAAPLGAWPGLGSGPELGSEGGVTCQQHGVATHVTCTHALPVTHFLLIHGPWEVPPPASLAAGGGQCRGVCVSRPALCHQHWVRGGGCLLPQPSPTTGDSVGQVTLSENQGVVLWVCARFGVLGAIPHVPGGWVGSTVG